MLKRTLNSLTIFFLSALTSLSAQVEKTVLVEHFTNSRCSVCANRNPDFFQNLDNHPNVLHIAIHPSSPYSNCLLNNNNPEENDERTNYYGIYGSTPKLVIQGENIAVNANYGSAEIFAPYLNQTTPVVMSANLEEAENGLLSASIDYNSDVDNQIGEVEMFVALVEDTVFYDAPNGEDLHFNVYRKMLSQPEQTVIIAMSGGQSSGSFSTDFEVNPEWDRNRLQVIAVIQDPVTKEIIQAVKSDVLEMVSSTENTVLSGVEIFPNPVQNNLQITLEGNANTNYLLTDISGKLISNGVFQNQIQLEMSDLAKGVYFVELENEEGRLTQKIIKE